MVKVLAETDKNASFFTCKHFSTKTFLLADYGTQLLGSLETNFDIIKEIGVTSHTEFLVKHSSALLSEPYREIC